MSNFLNEAQLGVLIAAIGRRFATVASIDPTEVAERLLADEEFRQKVMNAIAAIEFQLASNDQFGIVKGQQNDTPETWHRVSFDNGLGSIGREGLEAFIRSLVGSGSGTGGSITYQDIIRILGDIRLFGPDDLSIATNTGGHLTLQQATPQQYGVCKPRKNSPCYPQKTSWRTMNDTLEAKTKHDVHMFAPFSFPKEMPKRMEFFDRLTFIPIGTGQKCCTGCGGSTGSPTGGGCDCKCPWNSDIWQDFSFNAYDPAKDFIQDFTANAYDPTKDFIKDVTFDAKQTVDYTKTFNVEAIQTVSFTKGFNFDAKQTAPYIKDFTIAAGEFVPVTNVTLGGGSRYVNVPFTLSGTAEPSNATNRTPINWNLMSGPGSLTNNQLTITQEYTDVTVRATIPNGAAPNQNYTQNFTVQGIQLLDTDIVVIFGAHKFSEAYGTHLGTHYVFQFHGAANGATYIAMMNAFPTALGQIAQLQSNYNGIVQRIRNHHGASLTASQIVNVDGTRQMSISANVKYTVWVPPGNITELHITRNINSSPPYDTSPPALWNKATGTIGGTITSPALGSEFVNEGIINPNLNIVASSSLPNIRLHNSGGLINEAPFPRIPFRT